MNNRPQLKISREAVAKSLRELEILFWKKPIPEKQNTRREPGAGKAMLTRQLIRGGVR